MFTAAMLRPLPPRRQKFLAVMGLADEFTGEMAQFITKEPDTAEILSDLTAKNAFVTRLPGGGYRFHHMMKACAQRDFDALPPQEQATYQARYGHWYAENGQYLQALAAYSKAGRWDDALEVVQQDAGILLAALRPQQVLELLDRCGDQVLMEHPTALLVLMRRMFTWGQIPRMQQLKALLLESVRNHPDMTPRQRGNLLGECDLIESFLHYNDITEMSRLHRSASRQMTDQAVSIQSRGSWTFGSPSVLMMFHRTPGQLSRELAEMDDCMPHYYKITGGHGMGAQRIMEGEAALCRGMHYALVELYVLVQTAAAYEKLGKRREAAELLRQAAALAQPDGLVTPLAENGRYLRELLPEYGTLGREAAELSRVLEQGTQQEQRPEALAPLTEREWAVAQRMARRLSNREIAGQLFLTEGTVKQYINQIYSKLHLTGDVRTKRRRLEELMGE